MKIVADDKIPFLEGVFEPYASVFYKKGAEISASDVADTDALVVRTRTICSEKLLASSSVKFIASATIGSDHIDAEYCRAAGIKWTNAPGCNSSSVMQYIVSALLNTSVRTGISLKGKVIGVVGVGNVGSKVAKAAEALGMDVLLNDPPRERAGERGDFVSIDRILSDADFVSMHVPLNRDGTDRTFHMADGVFFERMKKGSVFINSCRGEVADTAALKGALKSGRISSAVLDVWENEPGIDRELLDLADIATPHIAGYSRDGKANGTSMSVQALSRFFGINALESWFPSVIPEPEQTHIRLEVSSISFEEALLEAVSCSYNIMDDDRRLRQSPESFEKQRGDYPLRREFPVFSVEGASVAVADVLKKLGFGIMGNIV